MDNTQYLLTKLAEEATEIAHIALKTAQFGFYSVKPQTSEMNLNRLHEELNDLLAVVKMLNESTDFNFKQDDKQIVNKIAKVNKYLEICKDIGSVQNV